MEAARFIPGLSFYPVLTLLLSIAALVISTAVSQKRHFLREIFPFIGATGALPPASCYFTLFVTTTAFSIYISCIFKFVKNKYRLSSTVAKKKVGMMLNIGSFFLICALTLGLFAVGAFQTVNSRLGHAVGASAAVVTAPAYTLIQCILGRIATVASFQNRKLCFLGERSKAY